MKKIDWENMPVMLTPKDLIPIFPGGKAAVYQLFHRDDFPSIRHGRRLIVSREAFRAWLENGTQ